MVLTGQDFEMCCGDDENFVIHVQKEAEDGTLSDADLTSATVTWFLKESANSATSLLDKSSADVAEIEILMPKTAGKFEIKIKAADTATLPPDKYFHGAKVLDSAMETHTVMIGYFTLLPKVG